MKIHTHIEYVSVEEYPQAAAEYGIMSIPTILVVKNKIIKTSLIGSVSADQIKAEL